jgi:superfamily II DNA or RNA helicase
VVRRYPESFLFCDEVGLGKTIEAGLALRQLLISGRVKRVLVLVPKGLLRQWQEELHEKLALSLPRLDGGRLLDVFDRPVASHGRGPWDVPRLLASSQLARRRDRRAEILAAEPWDLVIVDEAHHARRHGAGSGGQRRPNRLLALLAGGPDQPGLKDRSRCLYLLTATPMQVDPVEVWDLLRLLGLGGLWGAREESFLEYFRQLRRPFGERDWRFLHAMLADDLEAGGELDPLLRRTAERRLGGERWQAIDEWVTRGGDAAGFDDAQEKVLDALLRRHTPLKRFAWRGTRELLRVYRRRGLLAAAVPERRPRNVWIALTGEERRLYRRIERYVSEFYQRYEAERQGLGFVMTVYRRRLTSSFHAIRRSLERRLALLRDRGRGEDADPRPPADGGPETATLWADGGELAYVEAFVEDLRILRSDSKLAHLKRDLAATLAERDTVLVFTQYTDTLDYLRRDLVGEHGAAIACYSGRGGERWDGAAWTSCGKEALREAFRRREVRILLCTEAAGEGLNLQTCGVLINYDMPWNPMRVEQRIGRIDRIGQVFPEVWTRNYFYEDTVEALVYQRLNDRIRWFEEVVGTLEPILHRVGESIRTLAMLPDHRRARALEEEVAALDREIDGRSPEVVEMMADLDPVAGESPVGEGEEPPAGWRDVEAAIAGSRVLGDRFAADPEIPGAYLLRWRGGDRRVTFSPEVFDRRPYTLELLTWGHPLFDEILAAADASEVGAGGDEPRGLGLYRTRLPAPVSLFLRPSPGGLAAIRSLADLEEALVAGGGPWQPADEGEASTVFSRARQGVLSARNRLAARRRREESRALAQAARQVLVRAALVELAGARTPGLFDPPELSDELRCGRFGPGAVRALARRGGPFDELLRIAGGEDLDVRTDDPFYARIAGRPTRDLERRRSALIDEGRTVVAEHAALERAAAAERLAVREPSAGGLLERLWFPLSLPEAEAPDGGSGASPPFEPLEPGEVRPFENTVPLYDRLESAARRFGDAAELGETLQADEIRHPGDYRWVGLDHRSRVRPSQGLFVAPVPGESLNRRIGSGTWCLFRLAPAAVREGRIVLARHRDLADPDFDGPYALRIYGSERTPDPDGWGELRVVLRPSSTDPRYELIALEDLADGELRLIAELVEVLG